MKRLLTRQTLSLFAPLAHLGPAKNSRRPGFLDGVRRNSYLFPDLSRFLAALRMVAQDSCQTSSVTWTADTLHPRENGIGLAG